MAPPFRSPSLARLGRLRPLGFVDTDTSGLCGLGLAGVLSAIVLCVGTLALTLRVFYLIIWTAVKNGSLRADEERARRRYPGLANYRRPVAPLASPLPRS